MSHVHHKLLILGSIHMFNHGLVTIAIDLEEAGLMEFKDGEYSTGRPPLRPLRLLTVKY